MDISVIICTYNRAKSLRRTLESLCRMRSPSAVSWEVVIADNNSTDDTRSVCAELIGKLPLRYTYESRQGKSMALNRAVKETLSSLLIFTDDDVDVDPDWLTSLWNAACQHPDADFFGGRILPRWETSPPRWLAENYRKTLCGMAVHYDLGERNLYICEHLMPFFGANMAFRKAVFNCGMQFSEQIGPNGGTQIRGEETKLIRDLLASGRRGLYVPSALVHHRNPPERMTENYLRAWFSGFGATQVRLGVIRPSRLVVPTSVWFDLLWNTLRYVITRPFAPPSCWLKPATRMATKWGVVKESWQQTRHRPRLTPSRDTPNMPA